jgi:hypothetical protein
MKHKSQCLTIHNYAELWSFKSDRFSTCMLIAFLDELRSSSFNSSHMEIKLATFISIEIVAAGANLFRLISRCRLVAKAASQSNAQSRSRQTSHLQRDDE